MIAPAALSAGEGSADAGADAAREEFLKVNSLYNRELFDLAIPRYEKILTDWPEWSDRAQVHFALALSYEAVAARREEHGEKSLDVRRSAAEHAREALRDRKFAERRRAMEILGANLLRIGENDAAAKVYTALLEKSSGLDRARAARGLADALYERGEPASAVEHYRTALEYWESSAKALPPGATVAARAPVEEERDRVTFQLALSLWQGTEGDLREALGRFEALADRPGTLRDEASYMAALALEKAGEVDRALERFRTLAADPNSARRAEGLYGAGSILFRRSEWESAASAYEKLVESYPESAQAEDARLYLGRALLELGRLRSGARILLELRSSPKVGAEASLWLARAYASKGHHDQATKILADAIANATPGKPIADLELELGIERLAANDLDGARKAFEDFRSSHPASERSDQAAYLLAFALHRAGSHDAVLEETRQFEKDHPASRFAAEVRRLEAESLFLAGRFDDARARWEEVAKGLPPEASSERLLAEYRMAESDFHRGRHAEARARLDAMRSGPLAKELEKAIRNDPVFESFHFLAGDASYQLGDTTRAIDELERYLEGDGPRAQADDARFKLAHALELSGRKSEARDAFVQALEKGPSSPHRAQIRFELGQIALEERRLGDAREAFEAVLAEEPSGRLAPHAWHFLGWIAQHEGDHERAIAALQKLVDGFPDHELEAEGLYLLALSLRASGRIDESRGVLERLEREHPDAGIAEKVRLQAAVALAREGKHAEAIQTFEALRSGTLPPSLRLLLLYELAWSYRGAEQTSDAAAAYRELIALADREPSADTDDLRSAARLELGELEFDAERYASARELLSSVASHSGRVGESALYRLAWCHYREDESTKLASTWERLRTGFPKSGYITEIGLLVARAQVAAKAFSEAATTFARVEEVAGSSPEGQLARVGRAECLNEKREFEESRRVLRELLDRSPDGPYTSRACFALGQAEENLGELDRAIDEYRRAIAGGSEIAARSQFQIGQCLAAKERYEDAIVEFLQVPVRFAYPEWSSRALLQVAGCFEALEDYEKARAYYSEVIRDHGDRTEAVVARERLESLP